MVNCARILLVALLFVLLIFQCSTAVAIACSLDCSKRECQEYEGTGKLWSKKVCYVCVYVEHLTCLLVNKHLRLIGLLVCLYSTAHLHDETGCAASNSW